tara:strand:- start:321 stop:926 length:606 start_codon:yes stop_codon:yes gene_type:complete
MYKVKISKTLTEKQEKKIEKYISLATKFNETHNIFVRKNEEEVFNEDIMDCLPILQAIEPNRSIADLGSGGGLPGILISITNPNNKISLIESSQKKCYFLRLLIDELDLKNTSVINTTITEKNKLGLFDIITARAFAQTRRIISLTKNNIHKKSKYLLLKGKYKKIQEELQSLDIKKFRYEITKLDHQTKERNLIMIKKNE